VAKVAKEKLEESIPDLANEMAVAAIAKNIEYSMETLTEVADSIIRNPGAMQLLTGVKARDKEAHQHAIDTSMMLISFGRELGLPKRDIIDLGMGGLLHDIGMTQVLGGVFNTRKVRSAAEYKIYKEHIKEGIEAIKEIGIESQIVQSIVANHHERYDGSGFPRGLKKDAIGMYGNMSVIVDAYVSMVSGHGINNPVTPSQALNELLNNAGKLYHPSLLNQFIQIIGVYPIGSIVRLSNGQTGLVVKQNRLWRLSPVILVVLDEKKERLRVQKLIDLKAPENASIKIIRELPAGYPGILPEDYHFG
jgi:putative nucleotidyltransferase with HDIG domain